MTKYLTNPAPPPLNCLDDSDNTCMRPYMELRIITRVQPVVVRTSTPVNMGNKNP